jgi:hypothetical protein
MESRPRILLLAALLLIVVVGGAFVYIFGTGTGGERTNRDASRTPAAAPGRPVSDSPLADYRGELLDVAFETASKLPVDPFIKTRSRLQEDVATACFDLDQPKRALAYIERIRNWRRGAGYAEYAYYCAKHGDTAETDRYLELAREIAETSEDANSQEWRRDRIRVAIARTHLLLGQDEEAASFEVGLVDSEAGKTEVVRAQQANEDDFDERLEALARAIEVGNLDHARNALAGCEELFDRFYDDSERRTRVEEMIDAALKKVPVLIGIETRMKLAGIAVEHEDAPHALELLERSEKTMEDLQWLPEDQVPLMAKLAAARYRAGDEEGARRHADSAMALFEAQIQKIADVFRAETLIPLAEAYHSMDDREAAHAVYRRAVEEAVHNPNSRPRAEDLTAICCSMAVRGIEPDADLMARIKQIHDQLDHPW